MTADIRAILGELSQGRMIVLIDDEERENEGDLLIAASHITAEAVNFMARHGRGLICLTLTESHCRQLGLPMMSKDNRSGFGTNFTVSIEAATGVDTGISAGDRAKTVMAAANPNAKPADLVSPGHIFPVQAEKGGVLVRAGHTEAGCDLTALAGLFPAAVICEIMNEDGSMARLPELEIFAAQHRLKIGTIESLIKHRMENERLIDREHEVPVDTPYGKFQLTLYTDSIHRHTHVALHRGLPAGDSPVLTRVVINPTPLDGILSALPSGPSWGVLPALRHISTADHGVLLMLSGGDAHDGEKIKRQIGFLPPPPGAPNTVSLRQYGLGAQILNDLGCRRIHLLSSQIRLPSMHGFGLSVESLLEPESP